MRRRGAEVRILSAQSSGPGHFPRKPPSREAYEAVVAELAQDGIKTLAVPSHPLHYLLDGRPMRHAVEELLDHHPIDALLGWWHEAAFLPRLLAERGVLFAMNAAASYALVFPAEKRWRRPFEALRARYLVRPPLRRAAVVFVRSAFTRDEIARLAGVPDGKVRLVPCGIDRRFGEIRKMEVDGPPRILYFGRLSHEKGIFDAITALGRLSRIGRRDWRLRVAGWGDVERVLAHARAHGVHDRLDLLGPLARPALVDELARAELVLLPSYSESFGLANAEAQAAGVAIVAYRAGAVPEVVVDQDTGWLVPTGDVLALSEAIWNALENPEERHRRGEAGRRHVLEHFSWDGAAAATLEGLEEARGHPAE